MKKTAMVAMSGGVDSAVAAFLMRQAGYAVTGVTMRLFCDGDPIPVRDGESDQETADIRDARAVAARLDIPHMVCPLEHTFCREVVDDFVRQYLAGGTPNPCVVCNKRIKFGALVDFATERGLQTVATGHYARVERDEKGLVTVKRALDESKDQSYMLWSLGQDVLRRVQFPLGSMTKAEVRALAAEQGFASAERKDSQDICFLPHGDYADFIRRYAGHIPAPGRFVDAQGTVLGQHDGMLHYTIGQRKGLGIALGRPAYVISKDAASGDVVLGEDRDLYGRVMAAHSANWISGAPPAGKMRVVAKMRYAHPAAPATVWAQEDGRLVLEFDEPQRAAAPGQSLVLYQDEVLLGGGIIE